MGCTTLARRIAGATVLLFLVSTGRAEAPGGVPQTLYTVPHVPAQILVKRENGMPTTLIEQLLSTLGGTVAVTSATSGIDVVTIADDADLQTAIELLNADIGVTYAEPNYLTELWATPNDQNFAQQWSKNNNGINAPSGLGNAGADMNLVSAWDKRATAPGVVVAIIDDSLETGHIDLADNVMSSGRCFASPGSARPCVNGPNNPNPVDANDFHGTLVAGSAAARGNNVTGIAGAAWETNILPLKVDLSYYAIVEAIDEAIAQGADIINMSFGGPAPSQSLSDAISRAGSAGILVIASAGNADANNAIASHYPSDEKQDNVLSVAATDSRDRIASFSQWSSSAVHLAAPGHQVLTTATGDSYASVSGTSFSAPHTAGVAALVTEHVAAADFRQTRAHLLYGASEGRDALGPVTPGDDKEAVPGRVATGRLDADLALDGPPGGVLLVDAVRVIDSGTGNANGRLDPGETAQLEVTLRNVWTVESAVNGTLTSHDSGSLIVNQAAPVSFGTVAMDGTASGVFSVTLSNVVSGNEQLFLQLDLSSANGGLPARYFYVEVGALTNGQTISQDAQRYDWDEFQAFHVDVPAGASDLSFDISGTGDVDLLVRHGQSPEYLITLNASPGNGFYYVDSATMVSAGAGANESVSVANPPPGTWHAVVVNYDQLPKTYDITASYGVPSDGQIEFTQAQYTVNEGDGTATISVNRSGGVGGAIVDYATANGSATAGQDYLTSGGTLIWGLGENGVKTFTVPIIDDVAPEASETVMLTLSNINGATLGSQSTATLLINDNEPGTVTLAFEQAAYTVSESTAGITIRVERGGTSAGAVSIDFDVQSGQATAGADFADVSGTLDWADGDDATKSINIPIVNDTVQEAAESFTVRLSAPQGASLGAPSSTTVTITDDDAAGAVNSSGGGGAISTGTLAAMLAVWVAFALTRLSNAGRSQRRRRRAGSPR